MPLRLLIAGYYGYGNLGDEAILSVMIGDLRHEISGAQLTVLSGDPGRTNRQHAVEAIDALDLPGLIAAMEASDLLVLGGGGLYNDYWPVRADRVFGSAQSGLEYYAGLPGLARLAGVPCMLYAVGIGPLNDPAARQLTAEALAECDLVTVRDACSQTLALELLEGGSGPPPVRLVADPAFRLQPCSPEEVELMLGKAGLPAGRPRLVVAPRPWEFGPDPRALAREVAHGLDEALERLDAQVMMIPFHRQARRGGDDLTYALEIRELMTRPERVSLLDAPLTPGQAAGVIGSCQAVLAMRFHAAIFALARGTPLLALNCDPKLEILLAEAGCAERGLPMTDVTSEAVAEGLANAISNPLQPEPVQTLMARAALLSGWARDLAEAPRGRRLLQLGPIAAQAMLRRLAEADRAKALEDRQVILSRQLDRLAEQRGHLSRQLNSLRATRGVKLLGAYWELLHRAMPIGSLRRELARTALGAARRLAGRARAMVTAQADPLVHVDPRGLLSLGPDDRAADVPFAGRATDPRVDLLDFERRAAVSASGRLFAILTTTALHESEGQRSTNLCLELARRGIPVVHSGWRWHADELVMQERLDQGILTFPIDLLLKYPGDLLTLTPGLERTLVFAFPHPAFFPVLAQANGLGWITIYDVMDDWDAFYAAGQAPWFEPGFERHLIHAADLVTAVNTTLADRVHAAGRSQVSLLPNAAHDGAGLVVHPIDLEKGERTVGYFGHLAEAWFDWGLLLEAAARRPAWRFYLVGYGGPSARRRLPANIVLLGRQPRWALAALAANWDAAVVPFKAGPLADGVDAIKIYEYLAMGLPVVTTGVSPPTGAEAYVHRTESAEAFLAAVERASRSGPDIRDGARIYAGSHTWSQRVDQLLEWLSIGAQGVAQKRALFEDGV